MKVLLKVSDAELVFSVENAEGRSREAVLGKGFDEQGGPESFLSQLHEMVIFAIQNGQLQKVSKELQIIKAEEVKEELPEPTEPAPAQSIEPEIDSGDAEEASPSEPESLSGEATEKDEQIVS